MRGIRDKSKTGRAAAVPCVRFFFGLLRAFVWLRSLPNARGGENGRLLFASRRFFADGTLLRKNCRTVRPASARQSVRRCGTCRLTASRCTVGKELRLNAAEPISPLQTGLVPPAGRLTGIPPCFFDGDGGNKLPQPARRCCRTDAGSRHPCRIQLYAPARRRFAACRIA